MTEKLIAVLNVLNKVEVKGKNNLDRLLGCIQALEEAVLELQITESQKETEVNADG